MTGGHSRLGANDRGSFSRGVTQDYDTGANRAQIEAGSAGAEARIEGQSMRMECGCSIGDSKMWRCHFIALRHAPSRKHHASAVFAVPLSYRAYFFDQSACA